MMAVLVNLAPNISGTQTGNFHFTIAFDGIPAGKTLDMDSFDLASNFEVFDNTDVIFSDFSLFRGESNNYQVSVSVPNNSVGSFRVRLYGSITLIDINDNEIMELVEISVISHVIYYNTLSCMSANFSDTMDGDTVIRYWE